MRMNNLFTSLFLLFAICTNSFSNNVIKHNIVKYNNIETEWKTEYKDASVLIESKTIIHESVSNGTKHERVIFRYTNLTSQNISISFNRNLVYNGVCYGCDKVEKKFTVQLNAKEVKEFSELNKDKTFYIFSKDLKGTIKKTLDSFQLTNIEKN